MFQDVLRESWVYQEIGQEYLEKGIEEGIEQGREEERQRRVHEHRQTLVSFVQRFFPEAVALAQQQSEAVSDPDVLQTVMLHLFNAQTDEEAKAILFGMNTSDRQH